MNPRLLTTLNTGGVLALGALTLVQWRDNAALRTRVETADRAAVAAATEAAARARALATAKADLDDFRARLTRAEETRGSLEAELAAATRRAANAETHVAGLKANLAEWTAAVAARDTRLAEYAEALKGAQAAHAEAVTRHNALVAEHNALAARFARLADALGPDAAPVRLTREAIPAPTHITAPGQPRRALTEEESQAIVAALVGRAGHAYLTPHTPAPEAPAPAPTLVEGDGLRLLRFPDGSARFERPDLRVHLPAPDPAAPARP